MQAASLLFELPRKPQEQLLNPSNNALINKNSHYSIIFFLLILIFILIPIPNLIFYVILCILCYSFTKNFQRRFIGSSSLTKGFVAQKGSEPMLSEWTAWIRALLPTMAPSHPQGYPANPHWAIP